MDSHTTRRPVYTSPTVAGSCEEQRNGCAEPDQPSWRPSLVDRLTLATLDRLASWREAWTQRLAARWRLLARPAAVLLTLALFLLSATFSNLAQTGTAWYTPVAHAAGKPGGKHTFQQTRDLGGHVIPLPKTKGHVETAAQAHAAASSPAPHGLAGITMKPATVALSATQATDWLSTDGRLEVTIPVGAVTPALQTQAGGAVSLQITQLAGASGGFGLGASGRVSLGTYQFTLAGAHGALNATLAQPMSLALYLNPSGAKSGWRGAGFDLTHVVFVENNPVTASATLNPASAALTTVAPSTTSQVYPAALDKKAGALRVRVKLSSTTSGGSSGTWNTDSPQAHWDAQPDTGVDLSSGDLTYSYPLDVPAGPGGLTPKVTLSYDSSSVANEHNPQATAGWVGEGWSLSLGSISWGEHNVTSTCTILTCPNICTMDNFYTCTTFENSWSFSDPYGDSGELIPQDSNLSIWYDDTSNAAPTTSHTDFNLDSNPRVQIVAYTHANPNFAGYSVQPPCFRAFLPNGYMEEFGCTADSLQYYVDASPISGFYKGNYVYRWDLDMIVDPNGNQIHITYNQYENYSKANGGTQFPIDAVPATITYDSPSCHSTTTMCTGSAWQPAVQIVFDSATSAARLTGAACPTFTNTTTYEYNQTMRCDDVQDLSQNSPAGDAAPVLQSLAILNDVKVQVTTTPSAPSWQTLRTYNFSYDQGPSTTQSVPDPVDSLQESIAGYLDLTQIQEVGDDGSTALPPLTMTYQSGTEYYVDSYYTPSPSGNCGLASGMSWNSAHCYLWAALTGRYIYTMNNGRGWFGYYYWALAHNNTHGVNTGLTVEDPLTCNGTNYSTDPCSRADDQNWSKIVLTKRQESVRCVNSAGVGCGNNGTGNAILSSTYSYTYRLTDVTNSQCGSACVVDMYWGNQNDGDKLDFYNTHFMGFHTTQVTSPDGSQQLYTFYSGDGYGLADSSITCYSTQNPSGCPIAPWTDPANALHGRVSEEDDYDTNGTTLLKKTTTSYTLTCPPSGISGSAYNSTDPASFYVGQRTSELDHNNPVTVCEIETGQTVTSEYDGGSSHVDTTTTDTYAYNGFYMTSATQDTSASDNSQTPHVVQKSQFAWNDSITRTTTSASGIYFNMLPGIQTTENGGGTIKACVYSAYDGGTAGATGSQSGITLGQVTRADRYSGSCTPGSLSGQVSAASYYDTNGNLVATEDADALAGVSGHTTTSCTFNSVAYSACATYDTLYNTVPTSVTNALGQSTTLGYTYGYPVGGPLASNGWGQWLTSMTDANGQTTYYSYDTLGRVTATTQPPDTVSGPLAAPTTTNSYPISCPTNTSSEPCYSLTTTQRLSSGVTYTSATYYDGWGRAVETVKPAFSSGSTYTYSVQYTMYDGSGRKSFVSDPYFVSTSSPAPVYHRPDTTQPGTQYGTAAHPDGYDGLGRVILATDAAGNVTTTTYTVDQPTSGANITDTSLYAVTTIIDANSHKHRTLVDGLGHTRYVEQFSGNGGSVPYALYGTTRQDYDWLSDVTAVYEPNNYPTQAAGLSATAQATTTYDRLGRVTTSVDADLGQLHYTYDQNSNVLSRSDPRGSSGGWTYTGYDGLNRPVWRNTTNSSSGTYVTYTYDQHDSLHGSGIGRLTSEAFNNSDAPSGSPSMSGSYDYQYDARGRQTSVTQGTEGATTYTVAMTYNDANQVATLQYSDNEVLSYTYNSDGWLTDLVTTPSGGSSGRH